MGGGTSTTTASTSPSDPKVSQTLDQILGLTQNAASAGPTYVPPGANTVAGENASLTAATNPAFATGVNGAIGATDNLIGNGGLTPGQTSNIGDTNDLASLYSKMATDPASTQAGKNLINDVTTSTDAAFNNSGLFGSDNNKDALSRGITEGLGGLQQGYLTGQQGALDDSFNKTQTGTSNGATLAQLLPTLYSADQLPGGTQQAVGSAQDTAAQAAANRNLTLIQQLTAALSGQAPVGGATTASTSPTQSPLLSLLGIALGAA